MRLRFPRPVALGLTAWLTVTLTGSSALAASKLLVAASGDCREADVVTDLRLVAQSLRSRAPGRVLDEATVRERLEPAATSSLHDIELQLQTAQSLFYNGSYTRAEHQVDTALAEVRKLPPGPEHWNLESMLLVYRSLVLKHQGRLKDAAEANRQILRIQPGYALDRNQFAPQTHRFFEESRQELAHAPRVKLEVVSEPSGATVFLEGYAVGKTPYASERVSGSYQLVVMKDGRASLRRSVELSKPTRVNVDLAFEGLISPQRLACVRQEPGQLHDLGPALKLASTVGADELVLLEVDRSGAVGPGWLKAALVQVGSAQTVREGAIKVLPGVSPPDGLEDLVTFLLTGQTSRAIVAAEPVATPRSSAPGAPVLIPANDVAPPPSSVRSVGPRRPGAKLGWSLVGGGALAVGVGVVLELEASHHWSAFNQYYTGGSQGPSPGQASQVDSLRSQARTEQAVGWVALAVGAAGLGAGGYWLWRHPASSSNVAVTSVGLAPGKGGASGSVTVQWP